MKRVLVALAMVACLGFVSSCDDSDEVLESVETPQIEEAEMTEDGGKISENGPD